MPADYMARILKAIDRYPKKFAKPGELYEPQIAHDDWCGILHGHRACTCNPDIYITDHRGVKYKITQGGRVIRQRK